MNTVRSEKDSMGRLMSRQISCGAHKLKLAGAFPHFDGGMPTSLIHPLALTSAQRQKFMKVLGLLSEEKASAIRQAADEVLAGNMTTNSAGYLADRLRHAKLT
ncbi:hypothetical protein ACNKHX_09960 [Shigella flexneri]